MQVCLDLYPSQPLFCKFMNQEMVSTNHIIRVFIWVLHKTQRQDLWLAWLLLHQPWIFSSKSVVYFLARYVAMATAFLTCSGPRWDWDNRSTHISASPSDQWSLWKMAISFMLDPVELAEGLWEVCSCVGGPPTISFIKFSFSVGCKQR